MLHGFPTQVPLVFYAALLFAVTMFLLATKHKKIVLIFLILWLGIQSALGMDEFFIKTNDTPPRIMQMLFPIIVLILFLFGTVRGRRFIDGLDLKWITLLHSMRILIELLLYWLFSLHLVPQDMTFEGKNFDIFSGITAPMVFYFGFVKKKMSKNLVIAWNVICLALVINVMVIGILSVPASFQQINFDQPNIAVLFFPINLLPAFIVPVVVFSHLVALRQLIRNK